MAESQSLSNKQILEEVLGIGVVKEIWSKNFLEAIPFTLQDFEVGAVLPAMFYLFRRGYRRGPGKFRATFNQSNSAVSVAQISEKLASTPGFVGFSSSQAKNILADLLLSFNLENKQHASGRKQDVIRAYPTHYLSSWIDLPKESVNLRYVPELLLAVLVKQSNGDVIEKSEQSKTRFPITANYAENDLLAVFSDGMKPGARPFEDFFEQFDETHNVGIDQLLTIRLAQQLEQAPSGLKDGAVAGSSQVRSSQIANQQPIAGKTADFLAEDLRIFLREYGKKIPRQSFLPMLEVCIGLGMSNLLLSSAEMLYGWHTTGQLPGRAEQRSASLFVDCSAGSERDLRWVSEASTDECMRRLRELPVILMKLRLLSYKVRMRMARNPGPASRPDATERLNWLGKVANGGLPESAKIVDDFDEWCVALVEKLTANQQDDEIVDLLRNESKDPIDRFSQAATMLMGDKLHFTILKKAINSCWMTNAPHGMSLSRRVPYSQGATPRKSGIKRSIVLSNTLLDFLAHRHLYKKIGHPHSLSFQAFLDILRKHYGLYVDRAPQGQSISEALLQRNRQILENRLRDLGLLVGVNDAESMKFIKSRFE
jgi:hypothetical protein